MITLVRQVLTIPMITLLLQKYRLKLNSVAFNDGALYNFNYYEDNNITLPDKNAADKKDHLGYFNNQSHFIRHTKPKMKFMKWQQLHINRRSGSFSTNSTQIY